MSSSSLTNDNACSSESSTGGVSRMWLVAAGGANVGELLLLERIDGEIVGPAVDPDHHPFVHLRAGSDHHAPPALQVEQRIADRSAGGVRDENPGFAARDEPLHLPVHGLPARTS